MRGVGSSHRGHSIFFGKFFKKARIFAEHNAIFRKIPIFGIGGTGTNHGQFFFFFFWNFTIWGACDPPLA